MSPTRGSRVLAALAVVGLIATACSSNGGSAAPAGSSAASVPAAGTGGTVNLAVNPWVGYEANAGVVGYLLKSQLGMDVQYKELTEQVSWEGFESGDWSAFWASGSLFSSAGFLLSDGLSCGGCAKIATRRRG